MFDIRASVYERDLSGVIKELTGEEISYYAIDDSLCGSGLPLGAAGSKRFTLRFTMAGAEPKRLEGCPVRVIYYDSRVPSQVKSDKGSWSDMGFWYISDVKTSAYSSLVTVTGADALSYLMDDKFTDSASAYPRTLKGLVETLTAKTGLKQNSFYNEDLRIRKMPEWQEGISIRRALSCAAFIAGGLARADYAGKCEIVPCGGTVHSVNEEDCLSYEQCGGRPFSLNSILFRFEGENDYSRFTNDKAIEDCALNSVKSEGNPLATEAILKALTAKLYALGGESGIVEWSPLKLPLAGDAIELRDAEGELHPLIINQNRVEMDVDGLRVKSSCLMPTRGGANTSVGKVFNSDGSVSFEAIGEIKQRILALSSAYISSLTAEEIRTGGLLAKFIEATRLRASSIKADEVETDELSAALAEIVNASIRRLDAGTVRADELTTSLVTALAAKIESLSAASLSADRLASALAGFQLLTAANANFDRATVVHMMANALNVTYGVGGEVFIENLAADYASMVNASVGKLCVRASSGEYYRLDVDAEGSVSAVKVSPNEGEIESGRTLDGRTIIESQIAASELNASSVKAARALINRLDASRIDVGTLFAQSAFIERLKTMDITSNSFLRLALSDIDEHLSAAGEEISQALTSASEAESYIDALKRWLVLDEDGLKQGRRGSIYSTLVNESGFHILRQGSVNPVGSFDERGLSTQGVTVGKISAAPTSRGGWAWR